MTSNIFSRYIWLVNLLRQHQEGLSYKEILNYWNQNSLSDNGSLPFSIRTFHNHKDAIQQIFDISIQCNTHNGNVYYIEDLDRLEKDVVRTWLLNSFATFNVLKATPKLQNRVQFEEMPSAQRYLSLILEAMQTNHCLQISHLGFGKPEATNFIIQPYGVKVSDRRWYLIGWSSAHDSVRTYALDRIQSCVMLDTTFVQPEEFSLEEYFSGCCGISTEKEPTLVQLKVWGKARSYVQTLPLHDSQKEIDRNDAEEWVIYEYCLKPNINFYQRVFSQLDLVEVIHPAHLREEFKQKIEQLLQRYTSTADSLF